MLFDIEADGLLNASKIHVMSYKIGNEPIKSTNNYDEMRKILLSQKVLIGHNITLYDVPLLERLLGIKIKARLIDTLALSWYIYPNRLIHGLEAWGEHFGVPKPEVNDWVNLSYERYKHRCQEDVKINLKLWGNIKDKLLMIYGTKDKADKLIKYLSFKMYCLKLQQDSKWKLDIPLVESSIKELEEQQEEKVNALKLELPLVPKFTKKTRPKKPFKKDGSYSAVGETWFALLKEHKLPEDYDGEIEVWVRDDEPNPNSTDQIKDWLFSLGWEPTSFKFDKNYETGVERQIPQVRIEGEDGKELCPSVKKLIPTFPAISILEGLTIIQHRLSILRGFLRDQEDGWLIAGASGFTNTLRFKHRTLVNLPGVAKPLGNIIRGSLIAPDGYELCGSDKSSLEENTKKHYMYDYDPDYVEEMSKPGFDAHLDLAKQAGEVTQQEIDDWKNKIEGAKNIKPIRTKFKPANYACVYGVKAPRLSRETGLPVNEAQRLIDVYWERNWAVKKVVENTITKTLGDEMWLFNPVSELWYSLRHEKDIFSTLNQGTGVYCFDTWISFILDTRKQLTGQFHDEIILTIKKGNREKCKKLLLEALDKTNKKLELNIQLGIDIQFGDTYADIH